MITMEGPKPVARRRAKGIVEDPIAGIEDAILRSVRSGFAAPHERILPHHEWAKQLGTSRYRVERAIAKLTEKGLVYGRQGSGVYLTEKALSQDAETESVAESGSETRSEPIDVSAFLTMPHVPLFKTLRVKVAGLLGDEIQVRMWRRVFDAFHREHPFVNLEPDFSLDQTGAYDVVMAAWGSAEPDPSLARALDPRVLAQGGFDQDALINDLLALGRSPSSGELLGLPLLRTTTVLAVNHRLFAQYGVSDEPMARPGDWFRAGFALQEKSGGRVSSFNYGGFHYHGTFYGIQLKHRDGCWVFDRARMAQLLGDIKPFIRRDQLSAHWDINKFFNHSLGICCLYLYAYPWIAKLMDRAADLVRLPLEAGGYVTEGGFIGTVPAASRCAEEATVLLGFLASEKGQTAFVEENPEWLAVNRTVLARQKAASPYPEGAVSYERDPRNLDRSNWFKLFDADRPRMETEAAKFYLGMQELEETLDKMAFGVSLGASQDLQSK